MRLQLSCTVARYHCVEWERGRNGGVCSEKRFRGKESFLFGNPVLQWWVERGGGGGGFSCRTGCVGANFMPVIAVVVDEVGDFAKGLVCHSVLEGHGSGMGGDVVS